LLLLASAIFSTSVLIFIVYPSVQATKGGGVCAPTTDPDAGRGGPTLRRLCLIGPPSRLACLSLYTAPGLRPEEGGSPVDLNSTILNFHKIST
jgi:hypothetical protein